MLIYTVADVTPPETVVAYMWRLHPRNNTSLILILDADWSLHTYTDATHDTYSTLLKRPMKPSAQLNHPIQPFVGVPRGVHAYCDAGRVDRAVD